MEINKNIAVIIQYDNIAPQQIVNGSKRNTKNHPAN